MKRRSFLSLLSGAAIAPALPTRAVAGVGGRAMARGGYARVLAGLADYHAHVNPTAAIATPNVFRTRLQTVGREGFERFNRWLDRAAQQRVHPETDTEIQSCPAHEQES